MDYLRKIQQRASTAQPNFTIHNGFRTHEHSKCNLLKNKVAYDSLQHEHSTAQVVSDIMKNNSHYQVNNGWR